MFQINFNRLKIEKTNEKSREREHCAYLFEVSLFMDTEYFFFSKKSFRYICHRLPRMANILSFLNMFS